MTDLPSPLGDALCGRYTVEREIGRGGMATVYLAHDIRHDRPVPLKVLHSPLASAVGVERFLREIKARRGGSRRSDRYCASKHRCRVPIDHHPHVARPGEPSRSVAHHSTDRPRRAF
jgi:serine/threonine protein kinase